MHATLKSVDASTSRSSADLLRAQHAAACGAGARRARRLTMRVLFVCVQNAGRSQLARALWEARGGEARWGGTQPADEPHQAVVEALEEVGLEAQTPHALTTDDVEWADLVVTMG